MKLADVIHGKSPEIVKIRSDRNIAEAAVILTEKKIGALLVEDAISSAGWGSTAPTCTMWPSPS